MVTKNASDEYVGSPASGAERRGATLPLQGIRVLTLENHGAGPFGSMYLADLGAEVVKIENTDSGGDGTRSMGPYFLGPNDSQFFQTFNLNKKSVQLNLKVQAGVEAFRKLVARAQVVMNNLRGDQPEKLGLEYAQLRAANPRIVCAHLSAYGRDNERRGWPGYDYLMQAEAGYLYLTGEPGAPPARMGLSIVDYMAGVTTALSILAALIGVGRTGHGCDADVSLFDVALHQLTYPGTWFLNEGVKTQRLARSAHPSAVPVQLYETADGWIFIMCMTEKFWRGLVDELNRPNLTTDPRFETVDSRRKNREALAAILDLEFRKHSTERWLERLRGRVPVAPVYELGQALNNPFVETIGMIRGVPHPARADFRVLANPIRLDGERLPSRVAPRLGGDTVLFLREAGYDDAALEALRRAGAIGSAV